MNSMELRFVQLVRERMRVALYLGAHPDDVETGCAGTIVKKIDEQPVVIALSPCNVNTGLDIPYGQIEREFYESMEILGVSRSNVLEFEAITFASRSHAIRHCIEKLRREIAPDVVYIPAVDDLHQDHRILAVESLRAFRRGSEELRCYRADSTLRGFSPNVFVDIEDSIDVKIEALMCYKSQYGRSYHREEVFRAAAITRGVQVGLKYAEAFELIRRCE